MDKGAIVHLPMGILPNHPFLPGPVVPDIPAVLFFQPGYGGCVGKLDKPLLQQIDPVID
jgi:hypothetical protein